MNSLSVCVLLLAICAVPSSAEGKNKFFAADEARFVSCFNKALGARIKSLSEIRKHNQAYTYEKQTCFLDCLVQDFGLSGGNHTTVSIAKRLLGTSATPSVTKAIEQECHSIRMTAKCGAGSQLLNCYYECQPFRDELDVLLDDALQEQFGENYLNFNK